MRRAIPGLIGIALLGLSSLSASADVTQCLIDTGYAFVGDSGAATANFTVIEVFPGPRGTAFCDPPHFDEVVAVAGGDSGIVSYLAGTGLSLGTGGLATPDLNGPAQGHIRARQIFSFTLVPDDPMSSAKVPLTVTSRHAFGRVRAGESGTGVAANRHAGFYSLRLSSPTGSRIGSDWSSEGGVVATEETSFDVVHMEPEVFVNLKIVFVAEITQQSFADGSTMGSASAELSSTVTYAFSTDASTSIVFDMESLAGIPAPALGVVTVPEPGSRLLGLAALAGLAALRQRAH